MKRITIFSFVLILGWGSHTMAQTNRTRALISAALHGWEYELRAGFSAGGMSPIPFPREVRSIDEYSPTLAVSIEGNMRKWLGEERRWGVMAGVRMENKNMRTKAAVKNYKMEIIGSDGNRLKGNWTGNVRTKVRTSYLTVPVLAVYKPVPRLTLGVGPYLSYLMNGDFSGNASDGYLRKDNPVGDKMIFENGAIASYDFSAELNRWSWGVQMGVGWQAFRHLQVYTDFSYGIRPIFNRHFKSVTFPMYPLYLNAGFGYTF